MEPCVTRSGNDEAYHLGYDVSMMLPCPPEVISVGTANGYNTDDLVAGKLNAVGQSTLALRLW